MALYIPWRWLMACYLSAYFSVAVAANVVNKPVLMSSLEGVSEYRLQNGLRVILAADDKAQVVAFNLVYLTGSLADGDGQGGTAHLLEHLMFKGTVKLKEEQMLAEMARRGIQFNATTSYERTTYQAVLPVDAAQLDWLLAMEAGRMVNARFEPSDLDREIPVVLREMEIAQDNTMATLSQKLLAVEDRSGYGRHPLGTRGEVEKLSFKAVRAFYQAHYHPDNAVLVLSGKFDPAKTLRRVQHHFGPIKARAVNTTLVNKASLATATRQLSVGVGAETRQVKLYHGDTPMLALAYRTPAAADPLQAELLVLANVLAGGPDSRLHQALVAQNKAVAVAANSQTLRSLGMLFISVILDEKHSASDVQRRMVEVIVQLARQPITEKELQQAQNILFNIGAQIVSNPVALGSTLAEHAASGNWRAFFQQRARVKQLQVADVQRAATKYLSSSTGISGEVLAEAAQRRDITPPTATAFQPAAAISQDEHAPQVSLPIPKVNDAEIAKLEAKILRFSLRSGLQVALLSKPSSGSRVQGRLNLRFGNEKSLFGKRQIADLTATMLAYGSRTSSQQQLADRLNKLGASIILIPDSDHVSLRFDAPQPALPAVLEIMTEILREPAFPDKDLGLARQQKLASLNYQRGQPEVLANEELIRRINPYPQGDTRRDPDTAEAINLVNAITREDLVNFYRLHYGVDHGQMVLIGDFDPAQARQNLERLLGDWSSQTSYSRPAKPFYAPPAGVFQIDTPKKDHGAYLAKLPLPLRDDSKEAAIFRVINQVLGDMPLGARLTKRLRAEAGLSYIVDTSVSFSAFEKTGSLTIMATYPPEHCEPLRAIVHQELARLIADGITETELLAAKGALLQKSRQNRSRDVEILVQLLLQLRTGRTMQAIFEYEATLASISVDEVNAVIRKYLQPANLVEILASAGQQPANRTAAGL